MLTELEFMCNQCSKPGCKITIPIDLQGGIAGFHPTVGCVISSYFNERARWELI